MKSPTLNLVFGTGQLGLHVVRELSARGKRVRVISRTGRADVPEGVDIVRVDAIDASATLPHAKGAEVIYHCASPPYARWMRDFPAIQRGILECASLSGAKLIFADNLYLYGPVDGPLTEDLPASAQGPQGHLRAEMASMILEAHSEGRVRAAIGRASDFYGPGVLNSHAGERLFPPALRNTPAQLLGSPEHPHTFTYIRDFARGLAVLGENERALGQAWHIPNAPTMTTRKFFELVFREAGSKPAIRSAPRPVVAALALVSPLMRALKEQRYQFDFPFVVDHSKFVHAFGDLSTSTEVAVRETLMWFRQRAG